MTVYLVERDLPGITRPQLAAMLRVAGETSRRLTAEGSPVRYLRSVYLPGDARCLCLFEAASARLVRDVNDIGQLPYTRIVNALDLAP